MEPGKNEVENLELSYKETWKLIFENLKSRGGSRSFNFYSNNLGHLKNIRKTILDLYFGSRTFEDLKNSGGDTCVISFAVSKDDYAVFNLITLKNDAAIPQNETGIFIDVRLTTVVNNVVKILICKNYV